MKKGIIIYQSKYGATKKYAGWLRQMTGFDCVETPKAAPSVRGISLKIIREGLHLKELEH